MLLVSFLLTVVIYILSLSNTIYGGDAGDLVSAILTRGFAHPPGYSLYVLLGILANRLPLQFFSPAGRVTIISVITTVASLFIFIKILQEIFPKYSHSKFILVYTVGVLAFNYIVWLYAIVPEVFPLNTLIILLIYYSAIRFYITKRIIFLYILTFITGLALSHHHTFILVIPSILYLLIQSKEIRKIHSKHIFFILIAGVVGLLPNIQLIIAAKNNVPVVWGAANTFRDIAYVFFREGYGTFSAGSFVTQLPIHRLIQLKNLFLYTFNDFTLFGVIAFFIGCFGYLRNTDKKKKILMTSVFINMIFFGPVFFFYANFPLSADFSFATLERFLHVFYFFYAMIIYSGIVLLYNFFLSQVQRIQNPLLLKLVRISFLILLIIYPFGQYLRNYHSIFALKNTSIAENLGKDILLNVPPQSIILLAGDTQLFNTQYIYYSNPYFQKEKIIIHASKLSTQYYPQNLAKQYPQLNLNGISGTKARISTLIKKNKDRFNIYSSDQYPLELIDYVWVPNGILYKLEKKIYDPEIAKKDIDAFWAKSLNKNLPQKIKENDPIVNNLFIRDVFRVYSIAHQNTAYYYLQKKDTSKEVYEHIQSSLVLQPVDPDNFYLLSLYFAFHNDCNAALDSINNALAQSIDKLFLTQLGSIETNCFKDQKERERAQKLRESYEQKIKTTLQSF